ncbi:MAG: hypothetical protein J6F31_06525 [Oscillospiraceae bacterium]|nr:hypothetical protein [Oscillospiraceae bacterium]
MMDRYDEAFVFALKKWMADEINEMYGNGIYALCSGYENTSKGASAYIGFNTEKHLSESGADRGDIKAFQNAAFAYVDDDEAVDGSVQIWVSFKELDPAAEETRDKCNACLRTAFEELCSDGIIKERFGKDIDMFISAR